MRHPAAVAASIGLLALPLLAATPATSTPTGTASTSMTALELEVTGAPRVVALDGRTWASTVGEPLGWTEAVALQFGDEELAPVRTRSDGDLEHETSTLSAGDPATGVEAVVHPVRAWSVVDGGVDSGLEAATASGVADLSDLVAGLTASVDAAAARSIVTPDAASAVQTVAIGDVGLRLGGLVDRLEELPLDTLLALAEELGLPLSVDPDAAVAALAGAADAVTVAGAAVTDVASTTATQLTGLASAHGAAAAAEPTTAALQATFDALTALDPSSPTLIADVQALLSDDELAACGVGDLAAAVLADPDALVAQLAVCTAGALASAVTPHLSAPETFDPATAHADLLAVLATLEDAATALLAADGALASAADDLAAAVLELEGVLGGGDLAALLDDVVGLLDEIAGTWLVAVDALSVDVEAVAGPTLADASASVGCSLTVAVLDTRVGPRTCEDGLGPLLDAAAVLDDAMTRLRSLLAILPLAEGSGLDGLDLRVLSDASDPTVCPGGAAYARTCEVDGTVHATAGLRLVDLAVPALTVDPSGVPDTVGDLLATVASLDPSAALSDALGLVASAVDGTSLHGWDATLQAAVATTGASVDTAATAANDATAALTATLEASPIGDLNVPVTTPAVVLGLDPVSTASLTSVADAPEEPPVDPTPDPTPDPAPEPTRAPTPAPTPTAGDGPAESDPDTPASDEPDGPAAEDPATPVTGAPPPELPYTGGGTSLLGLAMIGGALALRRRSR